MTYQLMQYPTALQYFFSLTILITGKAEKDAMHTSLI